MMKRPLFYFILFLVVHAGPAKASETTDIDSGEELGRVVRQLDDPATEMRALTHLIDFVGLLWNETGSLIWSSGDAEKDVLRRAARQAVKSHRSVEVVQRALYSDDRKTRWWAVWTFEHGREELEPWKPLLPRLKEIAAHDPDANLRADAIQRLRSYKDGRAFLDARQDSTQENDPYALMRLLGFDTGLAARRARWYARAAELLLSPDEAMRSRWLTDVWSNVWNPATAPQWLIEADPTLLAALRKVAATGAPEERAQANWTIRLLEKKARRGAATDVDAEPPKPAASL